MTLVNHNGQLISESDISFQSLKRAALYGDSFFESMRLHKGDFPFLQYHWNRMEKGIEVLDIERCFISPDELENELRKLVPFKTQEYRFRLFLYRDSQGLYLPSRNNAGFIIEASPLSHINEKPLRAGIYRSVPKSPNVFSFLKGFQSEVFIQASLHSKKLNWDEAIILNTTGNICEATSSNIFLIKNGVYFTPSLSEACVDGVYRRFLLDYFAAENIEVQESWISEEMLINADEIFICNAVQGIRPIGFINKHEFETMGLSLLKKKLANRIF